MRRITQILKTVLVGVLLCISSLLASSMLAQPAFAASTNPTDTACQASTNSPDDPAATCGNCSTVSTQCDLIAKFVNPFIEFLSALVGVAVVVSIIIGGIQYSSSAGDPAKASAAKNRIRNAIIALVVFIALTAMLNFLIPGGLV